jgi:hypothetical protein
MPQSTPQPTTLLDRAITMANDLQQHFPGYYWSAEKISETEYRVTNRFDPQIKAYKSTLAIKRFAVRP